MDILVSKKRLPPEVEEGNWEYKLKINTKTCARKGSLQSQMRWRINQGEIQNGIPEAVYFIGIDDNGSLGNQTITELKSSINELEFIAEEIEAKIESKIIKKINNSFVAEVRIRKYMVTEKKDEIKVCFIGSTGVGKTSIFANLCYGIEDNNGIGRKSVLRYAHEKEDGTSSSIINEILGVRDDKIVTYTDFTDSEWENIFKTSKKIINLVDIPGGQKYYKTSYYGLLSQNPDYCVFVYSPDVEYDPEFYNVYYEVVKKMSIPCAVIFNKLDKRDESFKKFVCNELDKFYENYPVFNICCKDSQGIEEFKRDWISKLCKKSEFKHKETDEEINLDLDKIAGRFLVTDILKSNDIGQILTGVVVDGIINVGDNYFIGPLRSDFTIHRSQVLSIHKKLLPSKELVKGENGSLILGLGLEVSKGVDKQCQLFSDNFCDFFTDTIVLETDDVVCFEISIDSQHTLFVENFIETVSVKKLSIEDIKKSLFRIEVKILKKECKRCVLKGKVAILRNSNYTIVAKTV